MMDRAILYWCTVDVLAGPFNTRFFTLFAGSCLLPLQQEERVTHNSYFNYPHWQHKTNQMIIHWRNKREGYIASTLAPPCSVDDPVPDLVVPW